MKNTQFINGIKSYKNYKITKYVHTECNFLIEITNCIFYFIFSNTVLVDFTHYISEKTSPHATQSEMFNLSSSCWTNC